jgi:hypothetical protein
MHASCAFVQLHTPRKVGVWCDTPSQAVLALRVS